MLLQAFCKMETGFREIPLPPGCREAAGEGQRSIPTKLFDCRFPTRADTWPPMQKETQQRGFALTAWGLFVVLGLAVYMPVLGGRIPFPAGLVTNFPAWQSATSSVQTGAPRVDYGDLVTFFYPWRVLASG